MHGGGVDTYSGGGSGGIGGSSGDSFYMCDFSIFWGTYIRQN